MKCNRCGKINPSNAKRCVYCHSALSEGEVHSPKRKNQKQIDNMIIAAILVLAIAVVSIFGVYAYNNFAPKRGGAFGGGGGGNVNNVLPPTSGNTIVTLEGKDPDIEIFTFDTDAYDILIGARQTVTFSAEIFTNVELLDGDVTVIDGGGTEIGIMNDNGTDGDAVAGDGIYTLKTELGSDVRKEAIYKVKAKDVVSDSIEIYFYKQITQGEFDAFESLVDQIKVLNDTNSVRNQLQQSEYVESVIAIPGQERVKFTMKSGISGVWEKERTGGSQVKKGVSQNKAATLYGYSEIREQISQTENIYPAVSNGNVFVARPFRSTQFTYDDFKYAGSILANKLGGEMALYDNGNVTVNAFKTFGNYGVVLIDSHGTLGADDNPYILTGINYNISEVYSSADWQDGRVIVCVEGNNTGHIAVGGEFIDRYYSYNSLNKTVFYLGTCYSMYNDTIANALIRKGASAVYGFSDVVTVSYCNNILSELMLNQHILNRATVRDACSKAAQACGAVDPERASCKFIVKGEDDFKLTTDKFNGNIYGSIKNAVNGKPVSKALVRVYNSNGRLVDLTRSNSNGLYSVDVTEGDYIVKISKGHYKTAKAAVEVSGGITTYVETFMLIDAALTEGLAYGTVTNAASGDSVDGVVLNLRKGWNNKNGGVVTSTTSDANGYYEFEFTPGMYTMEYAKNEFITGYKNIVVGVADMAAQNAAISPKLPDDGSFRIVLSWSNTPKDLDSHLTGPSIDGGRFHLYFKLANSTNSNTHSDYFQLDLDNTDIVTKPNIPETTTIVTQLEGVYRYSVHDYTNSGKAESSALAQSNATVNVYKGSVLVATYHVPPNATGSIWTVFEISGNEIKAINQMGNGYADDYTKF